MRRIHIRQWMVLAVIASVGIMISIPQTMLLKYFGILIGIVFVTYILEWKKAWISQHVMLLMLSLLILSSTIGYGFTKEGISWIVFEKYLRTGSFEVTMAILGYIFICIIRTPDFGNSERSTDQEFLRFRLKDLSSSFRKLSHMMEQGNEEKVELSEDEKARAFDDITGKMCAQCGKREYCWEKECEDTCQSAYSLLNIFSEYGHVEKNQVPSGLRYRCMHMDHFLRETNRVMKSISSNRIWKQRFYENRMVYAGQIGEIAEVLDGFATELSEGQSDQMKLSEMLRRRMREYPIHVKKISVSFEGVSGRRQKIYMLVRAGKEKHVTSKQLALWISKIAGQRFVPEKDTPAVVGKCYKVFEFAEAPAYQIIQGSASRMKHGETVNGDSYAWITLDTGQVIMSLSDGMGVGDMAGEDSRFMINLFEQMVDTGFGQRSALRLINSIMMFREDKSLFSTMDLSVIDLYSGICDFIKIGASSTFIKRGSKVECVTSGSLPMGVFPEMDCENVSRHLFDGDVLIMVTDGVVNRFPHGNDSLCDLLSQMDLANPNTMAEQILNEALDLPSQAQSDDMTVLVCTVCKKMGSVL